MTSGTVEPAAAAAPVDEHAGADESAPRMNKVLLVGGDKVGKRYILQRLLNQPTLSVAPVSLALSDVGSVLVDTVEWAVETRYYSASLHFHVLRDSSVPRFSPDSLSALLASPLLASTSSVMLVYDASSADSLRAVQRWSAVTAQLDDEDSVMLCVGVEKAAGEAKEEVWDEARDWCIDHTIEHIRLRYEDEQARATSRAAAGGDRREDEEDEEGIKRIESAFHANHWQHMTLKDRQTVAQSRLNRRDGEDGDDEPLSIGARLAQDEEREEAELEAHLNAEAEEEARLQVERQRLRAQLEAEGVKLDDDVDPAAVDGEGMSTEERQQEEERMEQHLQSFEAMFEQMQQVRQEAMRAQRGDNEQSGGRVLTDAERRKRAEDALMSMMATFGLADSDEEES